ncbi:hypothetical protein ACNQFZ_13620 [Schinkia sp. CFF1]
MNKYICHVCGYPNLDQPPYGPNGNSSSHDICPCCGVEFGYEDCQLKSYEKYKNNWIISGANWFDEKYKPSDWNFEKQLENIKKIPQILLPYYLK